MELFTNRYQEFDPSQGVPVRTTVGAPKFRLPYEMKYQSLYIKPGPWFNSISDMEFRRRYLNLLDRHGVDRIRHELEHICEAAGSGRLVLLCFDDVAKGRLCHRSLFAEWWEAHTGEQVRELQHSAAPILFSQGTLL